uniref:DUF4094 domain-containing protein n=1 Tax=Aegilops tauschii subsp. strangulata TaxID=200361 RepID=A0A453JZM2_AEGTS
MEATLRKMKAKSGAAAGERRPVLSRTILLLCACSFILGVLFTDRFRAMPDLKSQVVAQRCGDRKRSCRSFLKILLRSTASIFWLLVYFRKRTNEKPSDDRDVMGKWQRLMRPYSTST